jgi:filamentous hemagglutinin family protein
MNMKPILGVWIFSGAWSLELGALLSLILAFPAFANPHGGTVAQGSATFSTTGSQLTIRASDNTYINWQNFSIGIGETTTFLQPSASSLVWNNIHDANPSQILGNLNANGYVVLQSQAGFFIGGQAAVSAHALLMTTAPIPMPDLSSGGAWSFNAPPPSASIVNYGQLTADKGGSVFLLANNIQNNGTIAAPQGSIGLYAGKEVLVSDRPDGRGLSATVTLPQGSVDNNGRVIADAGTIAMHAQVVNQGGLVQANSVREVNGVIQLVASDAINLGQNSEISARGAGEGQSPGGNVQIKSSGSFSDQSTSVIDVSGSAQGGNAGQVEISAPRMSAIRSTIQGSAAPGFLGGQLVIDPLNVVLAGSGDTAPGSGIVQPTDPPAGGTLTLNVNTFSTSLSQITIQAINNIDLTTLWTLADPGVAATLSLSAGNSITLHDGSGIRAGNNLSVIMVSGTELTSAAGRQSGRDGIYLQGNSFIETQNGNISLRAGNELLLNTQTTTANDGGIRTLNGGNITATALYGDVNTGGSSLGFNSLYRPIAPFYSVSISLGGISTYAGGDVTIDAGGNVTSFLPTSSTGLGDAGAGAFGAKPGNVTINAGGSVFGHYVVADGVGRITAGQDIGAASPGRNVALSLIKGGWTLTAPKGSIYLQEVRNPNGIFNDSSGGSNAGTHFFNYDPFSYVNLDAGLGVYLLGGGPRPNKGIPMIFPPSLDISAGKDGVTFENTVILFPSPQEDLQIRTQDKGNLVFQTPVGTQTATELVMSDSASHKWLGSTTFTETDHASTVLEQPRTDPVTINIDGSIQNVSLFTVKQTEIKVGGDVISSSFSGQNLRESDVTSIDVAGQIYNRSPYSFVFLNSAIPDLPIADLPPRTGSTWQTILGLALDPAKINSLTVPASLPLSQWADYVSRNALLLPGGNPGFVYNQTTGRLGFNGDMSAKLPASTLAALEQPTLTVLRYDALGNPQTYTGLDGKLHFATDQVAWVPGSKLADLYNLSLGAPSSSDTSQFGYRLGGPGTFDVHAGSISLGNSFGILSCGVGEPPGGAGRFANLAPYTKSGATLNVTVDGNLDMLTSTIAALGGGNLNLSTGGTMDLGSPDLSGTRGGPGDLAFGVFTTGKGNVTVHAGGDVNIDGSRIAAYNGGAISIVSDHGNVNAGSGGAVQAFLYYFYVDPVTGLAADKQGGVYGSGIVATTLPTRAGTPPVPGSATQPGDIDVTAPQGDILSTQGGILQIALNGNVSAGPKITLKAGSPGYPGNIDLGQSGVIGGEIDLQANGNISGLVVSRQNATINAAQSFSGTVLSGGSANLSAGGSISGTVIGVGGVNASGGQGVTASLLGQNVSVGGGQAQSTLGTTAAATATSSSAAGQASAETKTTVATGDKQDDDDKKKKGPLPALVRRVGRVTVLLP